MEKNILLKNTIYAFGAQSLSLLLNVMIALFISKILSVRQFGYWQLYLFYYSYLGYLNFGLTDGIYLKYGGKEYSKLPFDLLGMQFKLYSIMQCFIAGLIVLIDVFFIIDPDRQFVVFVTAITLILNNLALYIGYIFQTTNETRWFSISIIIDRAILFVLIGTLICLKVENFKVYVWLYTIGRLAALLYCVYRGKRLVFCSCYSVKATFREMINNMLMGISLTIANVASPLIIGFLRLIIDGKWGIEVFGKFSLAISMENFLLLFISQVSMVIFPVLRRVTEEQQSNIYRSIRDVLGIILPIAFLAYAPLSFVIGIWLPQYKESLVYLGLLLPICTYDGKMNLLCTTYFKVLRKERKLLLVNVLSTSLSLILGLISAYVFNSVLVTAVSLVIVIAVRSIVSEIYLANLMNSNVIKGIILETCVVIIFMCASLKLSLLHTFILMVIVYVVFLCINHKKIKKLYNSYIKKFIGKKA